MQLLWAGILRSAWGKFHNSEFTGLPLHPDGSYLAAGLHDGHWSNASCTAGGYRDFFIDASSSHEGHDNLFIEAVYQPGDNHKKVIELDVLSLNLFFEDIPSERDTEHFRASSPDGVYSLAVSSCVCWIDPLLVHLTLDTLLCICR
jgi:hypothetical protein